MAGVLLLTRFKSSPIFFLKIIKISTFRWQQAVDRSGTKVTKCQRHETYIPSVIFVALSVMEMGQWLIEELLQAKADEEPLRCGNWSEERCGGNSFQRGPEWEGWLSRCFFGTRIPRRLWWGAGLGSLVFRFESQLSLLPSPMLPFQFGLYMSQTSLMLTPTMESWQDREFDAKTSYLMDNVKYTSRGTFCLLD